MGDLRTGMWNGLHVRATGDPVEYLIVGAADGGDPLGTWTTPSGGSLGMTDVELIDLYGERLQAVPAELRPTSQFNGYQHCYIVADGYGLGFAIHRGRVEQLITTPGTRIREAMAFAET